MMLHLWGHQVKVQDNIKCPKCGKDTGLPNAPLHMVIPDGGLKCSCGQVIIQKTEVSF